tara:strand:+ start:917 stop:1063 length:147 start_codon:yes stop_codon:yes gene_type:complete
MKTLKIINRGDLLGSNFLGHISQIILGDINNYYIQEIKILKVIEVVQI